MKIFNIAIVALLAMSLTTLSYAQKAVPEKAATSNKRTATIMKIDGEVLVKTGTDEKFKPAELNMVLNEGDTIKAKDKSWALIRIDGSEQKATVEVNKNTEMNLALLAQDKEKKAQKTLLDVSIGQILIKVDKLATKQSKFEVKTPTSIVGVRGTTFSVTVEALE